MAAASPWIDEVLEFWFEELGPGGWFGGGERVDELVRARFGSLYNDLASKSVEIGDDERSHLAAVLVLDQFPRNLYRGSAKAFATDAEARTLAEAAFEMRLDERVGEAQRQFLYLPFMHSEHLADQVRSVKLYEALGQADALDFARQHKAIIDRFGRFPHRNAALGRESTPEEREFLETNPGFG